MINYDLDWLKDLKQLFLMQKIKLCVYTYVYIFCFKNTLHFLRLCLSVFINKTISLNDPLSSL